MLSLNKLETEKRKLIKECKSCLGSGCGKCTTRCMRLDQMYEAEIPVDYWNRKLKDFHGDERFKRKVQEYIVNIDENFSNGKSLRFIGHRGTGKTLAACSILKGAIIKNYMVFFITLADAVSKLISPEGWILREKLKRYDFMVLDEVDQRFFPSEASKSLYGNHYENIIRTRFQNRLPIIICTNSENTDDIFAGEFKISSKSLEAQFIENVNVYGRDVRGNVEKI